MALLWAFATAVSAIAPAVVPVADALVVVSLVAGAATLAPAVAPVAEDALAVVPLMAWGDLLHLLWHM